MKKLILSFKSLTEQMPKPDEIIYILYHETLYTGFMSEEGWFYSSDPDADLHLIAEHEEEHKNILWAEIP